MSFSMSVRIGAYCRGATNEQKCVRTLTLKAGQAPRGIDGLFAVIDGPTPEVDRAYNFLETSFAVPSARNMRKSQVEDVLTRVSDGRTSIALVLWFGSTVVVACSGRSRVYVFRSQESLREDEWIELGTDGRVRASQIELSAEDALVLVDSGVAQNVQHSEIQQEARGGFSDNFTEQDAAVWFTTLALRSSAAAGVLVAHFARAELRIVTLPKLRPVTLPSLPVPKLRPVALPSLTVLPKFLPASLPSLPGVPTRTVSLPSLPSWRARWPSGRARRRVIPARSKLILAAALGCAFVFGGSAALLRLGSRLTEASVKSKQKIAQVRMPATPTRVRLVPAILPVKAGTLESWTFPPLANAPQGKVVLTLYNPGKTAVVRSVRTVASGVARARTERVPAGTTVSIALSSREARDTHGQVPALYVQTTKPIVPLRVVVGQ